MNSLRKPGVIWFLSEILNHLWFSVSLSQNRSPWEFLLYTSGGSSLRLQLQAQIRAVNAMPENLHFCVKHYLFYFLFFLRIVCSCVSLQTLGWSVCADESCKRHAWKMVLCLKQLFWSFLRIVPPDPAFAAGANGPAQTDRRHRGTAGLFATGGNGGSSTQ